MALDLLRISALNERDFWSKTAELADPEEVVVDAYPMVDLQGNLRRGSVDTDIVLRHGPHGGPEGASETWWVASQC
jgi:hypothetical protein